VNQELKRNSGYDRYRATLADETAWVRARRPKRCKLAEHPQLRASEEPGAVQIPSAL
jgi:IS30 family transposase